MIDVYLALGSNLGERVQNINSAIQKMNFLENVQVSNFYESPALLPNNSAEHWNKPYINAVISGCTALKPSELLNKIKRIENDLGRHSDNPRWSPREIDIDILFYGNEVINESKLQIPHKEIEKRAFVILPLLDLAPEFIHPTLNKSMFELRNELSLKSISNTIMVNDARN